MTQAQLSAAARDALNEMKADTDEALDALLLAEIAEAFNDILTEISGHAVLMGPETSPNAAGDLAGINDAVSRAAQVSKRLAHIAGLNPA